MDLSWKVIMGKIGNEMFLMAKRLWPINRCITGTGLRETLDIIATELPLLQKKSPEIQDLYII